MNTRLAQLIQVYVSKTICMNHDITVRTCSSVVIMFSLNDLRERLGLHDGFTEGGLRKKCQLQIGLL